MNQTELKILNALIIIALTDDCFKSELKNKLIDIEIWNDGHVSINSENEIVVSADNGMIQIDNNLNLIDQLSFSI